MYKPLLFTTTLRNPERMKSFIKVLCKYEGQILNNELIDKVVFDLVSQKNYIPGYARRKKTLKEKILNDEPLNRQEVLEIIENSPQKHKEAGFDSGWPSRFDTWYKFFKELGLVYYNIGEKIVISDAGKKLEQALEKGYEHLETQVFLNVFAKYQRVNPYLKVLNNNKPLILLLKVIVELKKKIGESSAGISLSEVPYFICWKDDDYLKLTDKIIEVRENHGFNPSKEVVYDICKEILGITEKDEKRFKISNITREMPDDFIRKMRLTGLITLRGFGRFVDINALETKKVDYIIRNYSDIYTFESKKDYFDYMSKIDSNLVSDDEVITPTDDEKSILFLKWVSHFTLDTIKEELQILTQKNASSKNNIFKYINAPLRLEFLTALALQKKYNDIQVVPNYIVDDEGLPTSFAPGNNPDIVCHIRGKKEKALFEVTMIYGTKQNIIETMPIARHLKEIIEKHPNSFTVFIAPVIHVDTARFLRLLKIDEGLDIIPIDIMHFIKKLNKYDEITNFKKQENTIK